MNYFVVETNNMRASKAFYDAFFRGLGISDYVILGPHDLLARRGADFAFAIAIPFDEKAATNGNGTMVGFCVGAKEDVEGRHRRALDLGGTCEGAPDQRAPKFPAYVRDLDGNKLGLSDQGIQHQTNWSARYPRIT